MVPSLMTVLTTSVAGLLNTVCCEQQSPIAERLPRLR